MAAAYLVTLPDSARFTLPDGANAAVVHANSTGDAKAIAQAQYTGDSDAAWAAATVTAIAAVADLENFRLRVAVLDASPVIDVTVTGASSATIDDLGDLMVVALNATAIDNSSYNDTTQVLTIATGSGGDDLGDKKVVVELLAPTTVAGAAAAPIPDFVGAITDEGISTAALLVTLGADSITVPNFVQAVRIA